MKKAKSTDELLKMLSSVKNDTNLKEYTHTLQKENLPQSFAQYISRIIAEQNLSPAEVIRDSAIQRNYGYQILEGRKLPGRDKIVALALACHLALDETQRCLTLAGEGTLYAKNPRDSVLIFAVQKKLSVPETNELLFEMQYSVLQ